MDNGEIIKLGNIFPDTEGFKNRTAGRVYSAEGLAPTVRTPSGGGIIPQIVIEDMTDTTICLNSKVDGKQPSVADRIYSTDGCSVAITSGWKQNIAEPHYRIRKLTPRECFRLMGVDDKEIDTIQGAGISNSQMYKLAGNSIVIDVLYHLMRKMFCETKPEIQQPTLF